jgi:membrane dipeptidase
MVTFVPYFTTPEYWSWFQRGEEHWAELKKRHGDDRDAVAKDMARWDELNPAPVVTVQDVANHVEHVRKIAGIEHVGIGSDFDGMDSFRVTGLEDASTFPSLLNELARRGWTDVDLRKLAGGNYLRVLREVEAARLRRP